MYSIISSLQQPHEKELSLDLPLDDDNKAQRALFSCLRSHSWEEVDPRWEPVSLWAKVCLSLLLHDQQSKVKHGIHNQWIVQTLRAFQDST